uniref:Uncharacterized protein n=1 Tax=Tanacetum cinerariifolium TaxID=118510 RepID=A0A699K1G2_TANCI|nr:hypothetical protein [Tanacetum cinerariifolium]
MSLDLLLRDVSQGEACPTDSGFIADQDRATIAKSSTLPHDSAPRVTSPAADEGSMQHTINELMALCTSLQRQHSELLAKFQAQEVEINRLSMPCEALSREISSSILCFLRLIPLVSKGYVTMKACCTTCWSSLNLRHCGVSSYSWVVPPFGSQELPSCLTKRS